MNCKRRIVIWKLPATPKWFAFFFLLLTTLFMCTASVRAVQSTSPTLSISPATLKVLMGEQFTVNVNLDSANNLYGYEVWVSFNSTILQALTVNYTGYLNEPTYIWDQEINNSAGYIALAVSSHLPGGSKTGGSPPPLLSVQFRGRWTGTSPLLLFKTILVDDRAMEIAHQTLNGTVEVELVPGHDVAVTDLVQSKTILCQNYNASFTVSVQNQGTYTETFNVTLYANTTIIDSNEINLTPGNSATFNSTWNAAGITKGNYTMSAYAWPVPLETNTANNNLTSPKQIMVTIPGDLVSPFGVVDMKDVAYVAKRFGIIPPAPLWDPNADIDGTGRVDMKDIAVVARNFGAHA